MAIQQLLGPVPVADFVEQYYLKLPFSLPGGCRHLLGLGEWSVVEGLLAKPEADRFAGQEGRRWEGKLPASPAGLRALLDAGQTLGVRHAERHDPALAELAAGFAKDFAGPVDVHVYCTPAGQPGFGWHYDAEEVFVLQVRGAKEWQLRKNTVNPWPLVETIPADMRFGRELMPLLRCPLAAGDWLYIPAGYWHRTRAGEESISLSVGVRATAAVEVYDFLRARLLESLRWRQRLPVLGEASPLTTDELAGRYRELFAELGRDLMEQLGREELVRAFLAARGRKLP